MNRGDSITANNVMNILFAQPPDKPPDMSVEEYLELQEAKVCFLPPLLLCDRKKTDCVYCT